MWWLGVRDVEKEKYERTGGDFAEGRTSTFVMVLKPLYTQTTATNPTKAVATNSAIDIPENHQNTAFRRGYERGGAYWRP